MAEQMLITIGLNELKLLDARITRRTEEAAFVSCAKKSSAKVDGKKTKEAFMNDAKSDYESVTALIKRRNVIKAAIIQSNAVTKVTIAGKEMTVAEAIDKKTSIAYDKKLLEVLTLQFNAAVTKTIYENRKVDESIETLLNTAYGKEGKEKITQTSHDAIADPYRAANEYDLVDALGAEMLIRKLKEEIEAFESEVDSCLQISNSTTFMTI
ncbi:MAG: hypothetical protein K0S47_686 [Herbinix sp.]|nr:hypothetical protein [Herbinix sp.]